MSTAPHPRNDLGALLTAPRIGPRVLDRLQDIGISSIEQLRRIGVDQAVRMVCSASGEVSFYNRRRALQRALDLCSPP